MNNLPKSKYLVALIYTCFILTLLISPVFAQQGSLFQECNRIMEEYENRRKETKPILESLYQEMLDKFALPGMAEVAAEGNKIRKETNDLWKILSKAKAGCYKDVLYNQQERNAIRNYNERLNYTAMKMKELSGIANLSPVSKAFFNESLDKFISINQQAFADLQRQLTLFDKSTSGSAGGSKHSGGSKHTGPYSPDPATVGDDLDSLVDEANTEYERDKEQYSSEQSQRLAEGNDSETEQGENSESEGDGWGDFFKALAVGTAIIADVAGGTTHNTQNMMNMMLLEQGGGNPHMYQQNMGQQGQISEVSVQCVNESCSYAQQRMGDLQRIGDKTNNLKSVCDATNAAVELYQLLYDVCKNCGGTTSELQELQQAINQSKGAGRDASCTM